jgi:hypothetical protein
MRRESRGKQWRRFEFELLEDRAVPATFGVPWSDARNLTLSFVPDGAPIAAHTSTLFQALNAQQPTADWQGTILQAFQTWAVNANINIGLVSDGGQPLGVAGDLQHDPRFGDIRIGAQPMDQGTLSISVPDDPLVSSTLSGDVLLNSAVNFTSGSNHLLSALLHEAGHVFGIGDNSDPQSPMYTKDQGATQLTAADIAALQALYGSRAADPHEGSGGNDRIDTATTIQEPGGSGSYNGATPLIEYGDVTTNQDVDFYAFKTPNDYTGPFTIRLQSAGISLLNPHLTLLDAQGKVLGDVLSTSDRGDTLMLHLDQSGASATYFLEVQGATNDVFGIGSYGVAVTFDANSTVTADAIDAVLRGPYQTVDPNDINAIFLGAANPLLNGDNGVNDTAGTAMQLVPSAGYARNSHYEAIGSLAGPADSDFYRIQPADNPPNGQSLVLTVTARALDLNGTVPRVMILDGNGNAISQQILANGGGIFTVQAGGLRGGGDFVLAAGPDTGIGSPSTGNYAIVAQFGTTAAQLSGLAAGTLAATGSIQTYNLYVGESQLMHLTLTAAAVGGAAAPGSLVQMTVRAGSGDAVYSLTAAAGDTASGAALFLTPGPYTVVFSATSATGASSPPLAFSLLGEEISDPIGTVATDPTLTPVYPAPVGPPWFLYPGGLLTTAPFVMTQATPAGGVTPARLVSITVTAANPTIAMGASTHFTATGIRSDNTVLDLTNQVSWTSSVPGVALISAAGLATALAPGQSSIIASFQGVTGSSVLTVSEPPLVTLSSVTLVFGKQHLVSRVRVTFSGLVNAAEAQSAAIYRLVTAGMRGSFAAKNAGIIRLRSAVYDSVHHVVTLTPRKPFALAKPIQFSISGVLPNGLHDRFGRLIDGDHTGTAGGNAVVLLRKGVVTASASSFA